MRAVQPQPTATPIPAEPPFALLIDDDPISANVLKNLLRDSGFVEELQVISNAEVAVTYFQALRVGRQENLGLIFVDLGFPHGHGFEILRAIRGNPACASLYVAVLTGSDQREDKDGSFSLGADTYLKKFPSIVDMIRLRENLAARNN